MFDLGELVVSHGRNALVYLIFYLSGESILTLKFHVGRNVGPGRDRLTLS
jgi:hypothetical protein